MIPSNPKPTPAAPTLPVNNPALAVPAVADAGPVTFTTGKVEHLRAVLADVENKMLHIASVPGINQEFVKNIAAALRDVRLALRTGG